MKRWRIIVYIATSADGYLPASGITGHLSGAMLPSFPRSTEAPWLIDWTTFRNSAPN